MCVCGRQLDGCAVVGLQHVHDLGVLRLGRVSQREGVRGADALRREVAAAAPAAIVMA